MNDKYVVVKRDDFDAVFGEDFPGNHEIGDIYAALLEHEVDDAVVIRRQDMFAGPALHTYAASIDVAVKIASAQRVDDLRVARQIGDLRRIADYFHQQATLCDDTAGKLPD